MRGIYRNLKTLTMVGFGAFTLTACAPSSQMAHEYPAMHTGYGYGQTAYGYQSSHAAMTTYNSRYSEELRGPCQTQYQAQYQVYNQLQTQSGGCGFTRVVPVYPIYQYVSVPQTPHVPVIETPPVVIYEPAPEPVLPDPPAYEPPTYVPPVQAWPEPETAPPSWTPLRK